MQLNISELDDNLSDLNSDLQSQFEYEKIPENTIPIKVIKKGVHFDDSTLNKPIHQSIPKVNARIVRQKMPQQKPKISYEDILSKMGMLVSDGKLHLLDRNTLTPQQKKEILSSERPQYQQPQYQQPQYHQQQNQQTQPITETNIPNNSYIYNKYFKDEVKKENVVRKPRSLHEYQMMLIDDYIERYRIKQMKSTKLMMPTSNINISAGNSGNQLFNFSKR